MKIPSTYTVDKLGKQAKKELVITFDDGPDSRWTPTVLRILKQYHVPAAFFMDRLTDREKPTRCETSL